MSNDIPSTKTDPGGALRAATRDVAAEAEQLAASFAERAAADGLLDVAYTVTDSPFGPLTLAATRRGIVTIGLPNLPTAEILERLSSLISPRVLEAPDRFEEARRELDLYFDGRLREFDLPLDWQLTTGFRRKVLRATARIPYGQTRNYTEMAQKAGNERAQRATGSALGSNPIPIVVPCHRVLRTGGALGGYGGGLELKQALLELEGAL